MGDQFCVLRELIFAMKDCFFLLRINFCDFHEVEFNWNYNIFLFYLQEYIQTKYKEQHADVKYVNELSTILNSIRGDPFL